MSVEIPFSQRFEAKYLVTEPLADAIKQYVAPYMTVDRHARNGCGYPILSLYLDNPGMNLFWSSVLGEKNRFKLRIRSYDGDPETPLFFEIKRRVNQVILKQRANMRRSVLMPFFKNQFIAEEHFLSDDPKQRNAFLNFRNLMERINGEPRAMVYYEREAFASSMEEPVRVTFDRNLATLDYRHEDPAYWNFGPHWKRIDIPTILEIKFTGRFPGWIQRMVRHFNLRLDSFSKYVVCADTLHQEGRIEPIIYNRNLDPLWTGKRQTWDLKN